MAKKGFDLAALARESMGDMTVSEMNIVETIPAERIRANAANFYEMSDLEELAASIELTGLLHPVLVKRDPEGGAGYVIIDGERRFRAMTEVLGRTEIPCRRVTPVNDVIEELMLIEANRTQRKMTSAELSKQAERYTELLSKLRDSGVPIPGRLRAAVAEAMQVSETKLARLHAIRENLEPGLLELFDNGDLNESVAYELSKFDHMKQDRIWDALADANLEWSVDNVQRASRRDDLATMEKPPKKLPPLPKTAAPSVTGWDSEAYLQEREEEDLKYCELLDSVADRFLPHLTVGDTRQDGIQILKDRNRYLGFSGGSCYVDGSGRGLTLTCPGFQALRTWTDVYDMLCRIALRRLRAVPPVSATQPATEQAPPPAGVEWHRTAPDCMPPEYTPYGSAILLWGDGGLSRTPDSLVKMTINAMPETARWWAVVEGPKEDVDAEDKA